MSATFLSPLIILAVWESDLLWFYVPYKNRRVRKANTQRVQLFPLVQLLQQQCFCPTEQPDSSAMCTIPKAKHIVRGFRFCVQSIPEILRSVEAPQPLIKLMFHKKTTYSLYKTWTIHQVAFVWRLFVFFCSVTRSQWMRCVGVLWWRMCLSWREITAGSLKGNATNITTGKSSGEQRWTWSEWGW